MTKDYYKILGVNRDASQEEIKKSYRKMAHECHPDKKGGDEKKFKELNEAHQVLSDQEKRAQYDQYGQVFEGGSGGHRSHDQGGGAGFDFSDIFGGGFSSNDIFEDFFGSFGGQKTKTSGFNFKTWSTMELSISLTQAILGGPIEINTNVGKIKMDIPAGIQPGEAVRYQGGNLNIVFVIKIKTPRNISKKAKELLEELKKEGL
ncbi:MAG: DnaJ domain-containing protein [Candidatus Staskawiczbacteria bacterium]|nr:DnaJ domain-containing protein [Candidatus Staskawiczbacteria bacterium]